MSLSIAKLVVAIELSGKFNIVKSVLYHEHGAKVEHWKIIQDVFDTGILRGNFIVRTRLGNGREIPSKLITADMGNGSKNQTLEQIAERLDV